MVSATVESAKHRDASRVLLANAQIELDRGDLLQASEKAWGALAHYVKSVVEARGWENQSHSAVMRIAQALASVAQAPGRQRERLRSARSLHVNFYEDEQDAESVQGGINDVTKLVGALKGAEARFPTQEPPRLKLPRTVMARRD
jgi:hypothetical protein